MGNAIVMDGYGGPEVLTLQSHDPGAPPDGILRVKVAFSGVNYIDTYQRTGKYPVGLPYTMGLEGAGTVEAIGPDVTEFAVGDRVAWASVPGSYATHVWVPALRAVKIPAKASTENAAAVMLQGMTAHYLVHGLREPKTTEVALVQAAAGGTGLLLTQLLKRAGLTVIGTCGSEEKAQLAREAGADHVVLYRHEDVAANVRKFTDGRGVDVVYDSVGQATFEGSLASLRPRGLLALFGMSSGAVPPFDLSRLAGSGSLFITRPTLLHYTDSRAELLLRANAVLSALAGGGLRPRIGARFPLSEAADAHRALESRDISGKILLIP